MAAKLISDLSVLETLFYLTVSLILVTLWTNFIQNLAHESLGFRVNYPYHDFILALVSTAIFIVIVTFGSSIIPNDFNRIFFQDATRFVDDEIRPGPEVQRNKIRAESVPNETEKPIPLKVVPTLVKDGEYKQSSKRRPDGSQRSRRSRPKEHSRAPRSREAASSYFEEVDLNPLNPGSQIGRVSRNLFGDY